MTLSLTDGNRRAQGSAAVLFFTLIKNRVYIIYELLSLEVAGWHTLACYTSKDTG
jgi:hypothetical protein